MPSDAAASASFLAGAKEDRQDQRARLEVRFAHQGAEGLGSPQTAHPGDGEFHTAILWKSQSGADVTFRTEAASSG
jgi:hypothetical protein